MSASNLLVGWGIVATLLAACAGKPQGPSCQDRTFWPDADGDGYGSSGGSILACERPPNASETSDDCDDTDPNVHPEAVEICDGKDDDCDGTGDAPTEEWYADADGDGYGDPTHAVKACAQPEGTVADGTDCDDTNANVHPGAEEVCDGDDDDCSGAPDGGVIGTWYADDDGDGYGDPGVSIETCDPGPSWVAVTGDCDPANGNVHPGALEVCNAYDDDCDGSTLDCGYEGEYLLESARSTLTGEPHEDAGRLVDAGDLDGDGDDEIVVATLYADSFSGGGYIVDGPPPTGVAALDDDAVRISGDNGIGAGRSIGVGDADGDGLDDVMFGAPYVSGPGPTPGSEAFVLFGPIDVDTQLVDADVHFEGTDGTFAGHGSDLGDVTGDDIADAIIGQYNTNERAGIVFVVQGPLVAGDFDLEDADMTLYGADTSGDCGRVLHDGGDITGDGVGDLLAPAPFAERGGFVSGLVYVVEGPPEDGFDLADSYAILIGASALDKAGFDVAGGDVDGDGRMDTVVGAPGASDSNGAVSWVSGDVAGEMDLADADGIIAGSFDSFLGTNVDARDTDGDGRAEILAGAPLYRTGGGSPGAAFLFYDPVGGLDVLDATASFVGESRYDEAGTGVAFADVDGDLGVDVLIGAPGWGGDLSGAVYVVSSEGP